MGIEKFLKGVIGEKEEIQILQHKRSQTAVLKEKITREESLSKLNEKKVTLGKVQSNSKENVEESKCAKTAMNRKIYSKDKGFTPAKDYVHKRTSK